MRECFKILHLHNLRNVINVIQSVIIEIFNRPFQSPEPLLFHLGRSRRYMAQHSKRRQSFITHLCLTSRSWSLPNYTQTIREHSHRKIVILASPAIKNIRETICHLEMLRSKLQNTARQKLIVDSIFHCLHYENFLGHVLRHRLAAVVAQVAHCVGAVGGYYVNVVNNHTVDG